MISPNSKVLKINERIKLYNIEPQVQEEKLLLKIYDNIRNMTPENTKISLNFFKDGETFHGEALVGNTNICVLSRKLSHDFKLLLNGLNADLIRKLIKYSRNHRDHSSHEIKNVV